MTPAPTLESLRRVEAMLVGATGPDRELDVLILTTCLGYRDIDGILFDRGNDGYWTLEGDERNRPLPDPTSSIDAAKSWLPAGCGISMVEPEPGDGKPYASIYNKVLGHIARGSAPTLPLAVNLAIVRAHIALSTTATRKEQES